MVKARIIDLMENWNAKISGKMVQQIMFTIVTQWK